MREIKLKKIIYLAILVIILGFIPAYALEDESFDSSVNTGSDQKITTEVSDPDDVIFRSSATEMIETFENMNMYNPMSTRFEGDFTNPNSNSKPFIKQLRLKVAEKYKYKESDKTTKSKWIFWKNKDISADDTNIELEKPDSDLLKSIDSVANIETSDSIELEGSVNAENVEKQLLLDASNINYDNVTGEMVATGRPILFLPPQKTKIIADVMTYDDQGNILKANGNVLIIKDGKTTHSDYLVVNLNEETMDADNIFAEFPKLNITAEHGTQQDGLLIFNNGTMFSDHEGTHRIKTQMIGPYLDDMIIAEDEKSLFFGQPEHSVDIKISNLEIDARKNHDIITAKKIQIGHNDKYFFKWPSIKIYTNKERDYFEASYPEFGSLPKMGMFIGPGIVFGGPFGSVIKAVPMINYDKKFGVGGIVKYINSFNRTDFGYSSAKNRFLLRGRQQLDDDLYLQYGYNSYMNDWFMGERMPKLMAELVYNKAFFHRGFLGGERDMKFSHRASFGFMKDDNENQNGEKFDNNTNFSSTRTKYMAQIHQSLYKYENKTHRVRINAGVILQGSAALYGSGDTQFIAMGGPNLRFQFKNWIQDASYFLTGYHDESPMPHFDAYRYGTSSFRLVEALRLNKYITVGWQTYINISDDAPNGKHFQENAFLVSLGPDDLKVILGYDLIRERTYFGVNIAFNPKGTTIRYDKMVIKNPEKLGINNQPEEKVAFIPADNSDNNSEKGLITFQKPAPKKEVLEYAEVIELEDPEKERID